MVPGWECNFSTTNTKKQKNKAGGEMVEVCVCEWGDESISSYIKFLLKTSYTSLP